MTHARAPASARRPVERELAFDMLRRGVVRRPVVLVARRRVVWGGDGAASAALRRRPRARQPRCSSAVALSWAAKVSLTALMAVALGGFAVRLGLVTAGRRPRQGRAVDRPDRRSASPCSSPTSASCSGSPLRVRFARLPGLKPGAAKEASHLVIFGLEFPPVSHVIEWPDLFLERHVRGEQGRAADVAVGRSSCSASSSSPAGDSSARARRACRTWPSRPSTSSRRASSCRRWAPTGCRGRRSCSRCSRSSSSATSGRSSRSSRCR